jgi:hypothetical protein
LAEQTVEIENFGEGGVASEATLKLLLKAMDNLAKGQGTEAKKTKDAVKKYHDEMKSGVKVFKENRDALEDHTDAVEEATVATNNFAKGALGLAISGISTLASSAFNLGKELLVGGDNFADFAQHVPLVGGHLAGLVGILDDNINSFREMTQIGVDFGGSIIELRKAATESGLSMQNFQRVVSENSTSLALLGGSAGDGARRFRNISGELQRNFGPQLSRLGMTMEETADYTASYLEIQTRLGRAQRMNDSQLAAGSAAYALQLDKLAKITGKRRDQIADELEQQMADRRIRGLVASMGEEQARALQNVTASIENADLQEAITELVATGGVPLENELAKSIARMTPELAEASARLREGNITEEEYFAVLRRNSGAMEEFLRQNGDQAALIAATGNSAYDAAFALQGLSNIGEDYAQVTDEQRDAMENGQRELLDFGRALQDFRNEIIGRLIDSGAFQMLETQLSRLVDWMKSPEGLAAIESVVNKFSAWLGGLVNDFESKGIWETITERVGDALDGMIGGLVTKIGIAIVGLFAARSLLSAVSGGITSALGGLFGGGGSGGRQGGSRGGPAGRSGGNTGANVGRNVGGFVGGLAGGVMEGAAKGLAAFANPQILVGAGILGASITAIGAGIAGAAWLTGKALPTFVDGIKEFESVDGAAISAAASGMLALSGAMAAFGAGTAVAGLGSMVGAITEGIAGLFGGEDPMEKLQRFASYDIDAAKVENNARAMAAFSRAMAAQGAGAAVSGVGSAIGAIGDAISSFFGGETPLEKVKAFGDADINAEGVANNAEAMASMATALSSFTGEGISDIEIPRALVNRFEEIAAITGTGFNTTATGLQALANVTGLSTMVTSLNSLDATQLSSYNTAMESLVDTLEELNTVLAETNEGGLFGGGTGVAAADVLGQIGGSTAGSNQQLAQLNNTMMQVLDVLREQYDVQEETARGTRRLQGNLIAGM